MAQLLQLLELHACQTLEDYSYNITTIIDMQGVASRPEAV
jgi:hypothetical protein